MAKQKFYPFLPSRKEEYSYDDEKDFDILEQLEVARDFLVGLKQNNTYSTDIHNAVTGIETALLNLDRFRQIRKDRYGIVNWKISEQHNCFAGFSKFTKPLDVTVEVITQHELPIGKENQSVMEEFHMTIQENVRPANFIPFLLGLFNYLFPTKPVIVKEQKQFKENEVSYKFYISKFNKEDVEKIRESYTRLLNSIDEEFKQLKPGEVCIITDNTFPGQRILGPLKLIKVNFGEERRLESLKAINDVFIKLTDMGDFTIKFDNRPGVLFSFGLEDELLKRLEEDLKKEYEEISKRPTLKSNLIKQMKD